MALTLPQPPFHNRSSTIAFPPLSFLLEIKATSVTMTHRRLQVLCRNGSEASAAVNFLDYLITPPSIKQASKRSAVISSASPTSTSLLRDQASTDTNQALSSRRDTYPRRRQRAAVAASGFETRHPMG